MTNKIYHETNAYLKDDHSIGVANYLVSLYYRTGLKYNFHGTKLNRLLTIYKLCSMKYNAECLSDAYFWIRDDGTMGMHKLVFSLVYNFGNFKEEDRRPITEKFNTFDKSKKYLYEEFRKPFYDARYDISDDSKQLLELIFRKFGNYSINDLAPMINEIVLKLPIRKALCNNNYIDFYDFKKFLIAYEIELKDNEIFNFIQCFNTLNISSSSKLSNHRNKDSNNQNKVDYSKKYPFFLSKFKRLKKEQQQELIYYLTEMSESNNLDDKNKVLKI